MLIIVIACTHTHKHIQAQTPAIFIILKRYSVLSRLKRNPRDDVCALGWPVGSWLWQGWSLVAALCWLGQSQLTVLPLGKGNTTVSAMVSSDLNSRKGWSGASQWPVSIGHCCLLILPAIPACHCPVPFSCPFPNRCTSVALQHKPHFCLGCRDYSYILRPLHDQCFVLL